MKYYVFADVHGFYTKFREALEEAGWYADTEPHRLVILGDMFDRGPEAKKMQEFILELMEQDAVILIRGNHEDLFSELVTIDQGLPVRHHIGNGTYDTLLQLTDFDRGLALKQHWDLAEAGQKTPYYTKIIPATIDYYETAHYIFVHGWIPVLRRYDGSMVSDPYWRRAGQEEWHEARWENGMSAVSCCREEKTILCGHYHCSWGHAFIEGKGTEFGPDADFSPYRAPGIIALDACTAYSGRVNVIVIEDDPM